MGVEVSAKLPLLSTLFMCALHAHAVVVVLCGVGSCHACGHDEPTASRSGTNADDAWLPSSMIVTIGEAIGIELATFSQV